MPNENNGTQKNYSLQERIEYHLNLSKKGAVKADGTPVSEFQRGKHAQKAESLMKQKSDFITAHPEAIPADHLQSHLAAKQRRREERAAYLTQQQNQPTNRNGGGEK